MGVVTSSDVVLAYLNYRQKVTEKQLMRELNLLCNNLVEEGVFTPIDFNFYEDRITSDVIQDSLWEFTSSGIIDEEHLSDLTYTMTEYGNTISDQLLQSFKEKQRDEWDAYTKVLEIIT